MFDWLRYRYQLSRLQLERRWTLKNEARLTVEEWSKRLTTLNEDIYVLKTNYLIDTAEKLMIETPDPSPPDWIKAKSRDWGVYLSEPAMFKLRAAIRAERRDRSELARSWLSSITGLIGALIGLLAVILGRR